MPYARYDENRNRPIKTPTAYVLRTVRSTVVCTDIHRFNGHLVRGVCRPGPTEIKCRVTLGTVGRKTLPFAT